MNPPADLSPIAQCLRIAAQRGRALRLQREAAQQEQPADDAAPRHDAQAQHSDNSDAAQKAGQLR
jgi:hypothetical protein